MEALEKLLASVVDRMGIIHLDWRYIVMWTVAFFFLYLAVKKKYEPLLLLPIGFGIFLVRFCQHSERLCQRCAFYLPAEGVDDLGLLYV